MFNLHFHTLFFAAVLFIPVAVAQIDDDASSWFLVQCSSEDQVRAYLEKFPQGQYVEAANKCLRVAKLAKLANLEAEAAKRNAALAQQKADEAWKKVAEAEAKIAEAEEKLRIAKSEREKKRILAEKDDKLNWESVHCSSKEKVRTYLENYPQGQYVEEASNCLEKINVSN